MTFRINGGNLHYPHVAELKKRLFSFEHRRQPLIRSHFSASVFGLTGESKRNLINVLK